MKWRLKQKPIHTKVDEAELDFFKFQTGSQNVAQTGLELVTPLLPLMCWDYKFVPAQQAKELVL
jgi:hypothetical protein